MKVLVVDDSEDMRLLLERRLSKYSDDVVVAENGELGYTAFIKHKPDFIISDMQMPVMDGVGMAERIRSEGYTTPIILHTGDPSKCSKPELFDKVVSKSYCKGLDYVLEEYFS